MQLVSAILKCIGRSGQRNYRVVTELDAGVGFADIVLYKRNSRTTKEIRRLAEIPPRLAPLLDPVVANDVRGREDLMKALGLLKPAAQRVLKQLQLLGLFKNTPIGTLASVRNLPFDTVIAIEAKLSDWRRALIQGYRNRQFADESWVVLDHRCCKAALTNVERFKRSGVGLASIDVGGNLYIHSPAVFAPGVSREKQWQAQAALARRVIRRSR